MHEPRKYDFIDALRGIAILLVILVHATLAVPPASPTLATLTAGGARGVQLFYIASALALCLSWDFRSARERSPLRNFYLRRWFRIAPMFYVAIAAYLAIDGLAPRFFAPNGLEWYYVPLTALFVNGFHPETITSVVPGGWSIAVEMSFYLVLPFLAMRFRSVPAMIILVAASLIIDRLTGYVFMRVYLPMYPPEQAYLVENFRFLNFFSQFPVFAIGMLAYSVFQRPALVKPAIAAGAATVLLWLLVWPRLSGATLHDVAARHVEIGGAFAVLALALSAWPVRVLVNPATRWIGRLSFSMYLSHFAVLQAFAALGVSRAFGSGTGGAMLHYACVVCVTAAVSWVCYMSIERPGIEMGRRWIDRLDAGRAAAQVA